MLNKLAHKVMKLFKTNTNSKPLALNTIVKVNQLTSFDMIYVYHLLRIGTKVKLYKTDTDLSGNYLFDVYYKTFKIGTIKISGIRKILLGETSDFEAIISNLSKEKYLPLKSLELTINAKNNLKMVS